MSNVHYNVFLKGVFNLTATLTIKSEQSARSLNSALSVEGWTIDDLAPASWKYYLNLAGRYHASDKMMTVKSTETGEIIEFTVDNLREHRTTRVDHAYGSKKYWELLSRYPDQQELILGILNPIDINEAIAANDHSILHYDESLVESQESNLIAQLQIWIDSVFRRWHVSNFNLYANLFEAGFLTVIYSQMPQQILNIREDNCNTELAHSYHIRAYLDSFGNLGQYFEYMTWKQKLFFYRNLRWLNANSGRWETFDLLKERIFTDRRFPLSEFNIRHNPANIVDDLMPEVEMVRSTINGYESEVGVAVQSLRQVLDLEDGLATMNTEVKDDAELTINNAVRRSKFSQLETKVLESSVVDRTGSGAITLEEMLTNHWPYLAKINRYKTLVNFVHPTTGEEIALDAYDAFLLWLYAYSCAASNPLKDVPTVGCWCVRRTPIPTKSELRSIVEGSKVPDYLIDAALDNQPVINTVISPITYMELITKIYDSYMLHEDLYRYQDDMDTNGQVEQMVGRFYQNYDISLEEPMSYNQWLSSKNLDFDNVNEDQFFDLAMALFGAATGYVADTTQRLSEIHSAHVRMMAQLSTYSVQFIHNSNSNELVELRWKMIRPGNTDIFSRGYDRGVFAPITIIEAKGRTRGKTDVTLRTLEAFDEFTYTRNEYEYEMASIVYEDFKSSSHEHLKMSKITGDLVVKDKIDLSAIALSDTSVGYEMPQETPLSSLFTQTIGGEYKTLTANDISTLRART